MNSAFVPKGLLLVVLLFACGACSSTPKSRLYALQSPKAFAVHPIYIPALEQLHIVVSDVRIPAHLERSVILTHKDGAEFEYSEYRRWAAPLDNTITEVLAANVAAILSTGNVVLSDQARSVEQGYRVDVRIVAMSATLGSVAELVAQWTLYALVDDQLLETRITHYTQDLIAGGYREYISAQNAMLLELSRDIAHRIREAIDRAEVEKLKEGQVL